MNCWGEGGGGGVVVVRGCLCSCCGYNKKLANLELKRWMKSERLEGKIGGKPRKNGLL